MMDFSQLSSQQQLEIIKKEFAILVKNIFEEPKLLLNYVNEAKITKSQSRYMLKHINTLNTEKCECCRRFDPTKLNLPIRVELEPLIDIVQSSVKSKQY
jgi:hypothetical protein